LSKNLTQVRPIKEKTSFAGAATAVQAASRFKKGARSDPNPNMFRSTAYAVTAASRFKRGGYDDREASKSEEEEENDKGPNASFRTATTTLRAVGRFKRGAPSKTDVELSHKGTSLFAAALAMTAVAKMK